MKAKEVFEFLLEGIISEFENTCDGLISGDENKLVEKIGTCFKLTAELIEKAVDAGVDMIITHEPTFVRGDISVEETCYGFDLLKKKMLDDSGITVYRYHDYAHHREDDYIHRGFIKALGLKIKHKYPRESLGVCRYELDEVLTTRELGVRVRENLGVECVRVVGKDDYPLKCICLGLGSVGMAQINKLFDPGCDLFVAGEVGEVCVDQYVRDACYFGENKSLMIIGHYGSEYAGMRLLAEELNEKLAPCVFLEGGEVYHHI